MTTSDRAVFDLLNRAETAEAELTAHRSASPSPSPEPFAEAGMEQFRKAMANLEVAAVRLEHSSLANVDARRRNLAAARAALVDLYRQAALGTVEAGTTRGATASGPGDQAGTNPAPTASASIAPPPSPAAADIGQKQAILCKYCGLPCDRAEAFDLATGLSRHLRHDDCRLALIGEVNRLRAALRDAARAHPAPTETEER